MWNAPALVRWNADKVYLRDIEASGIFVPPTVFVENGEPLPDFAQLRRRFGSDRVVVKPTIAATAWRTASVSLSDESRVRDAVDATRAGGCAMVQAYLPAIADGEWSVVFVGGRLSHAAEVVEGAERVLRALPGETAYLRIDGVVQDGVFVLMEAEAVEPDLFLRMRPESADELAAWVVERVTP